MVPSKFVRNTAVRGVFGLTLLLGCWKAEITAQAFCDPSYGETTNGCVPGDRDYDCPELWEQGIGDIPVLGSDWMRLDGYQDFASGEWISHRTVSDANGWMLASCPISSLALMPQCPSSLPR